MQRSVCNYCYLFDLYLAMFGDCRVISNFHLRCSLLARLCLQFSLQAFGDGVSSNWWRAICAFYTSSTFSIVVRRCLAQGHAVAHLHQPALGYNSCAFICMGACATDSAKSAGFVGSCAIPLTMEQVATQLSLPMDGVLHASHLLPAAML